MLNKFGVSEKKFAELLKKMEELSLSEGDFVETFIRGSGKGGQKVNKTSSCVRLYFQELDIEVKVQSSRNRALNRFLARRLLCEKIEELRLGSKSPKAIEIEKKRKQKARRARRSLKKS
jgi:protein subunit release factor B